MAFRVELTRRALRDLTDLYETIRAGQSPPAARWFNDLERTILGLEDMPHMGMPTHEDTAIRQLIFGNKPHLYRVLYRLEDAARVVRILQIRHGRRLP